MNASRGLFTSNSHEPLWSWVLNSRLVSTTLAWVLPKAAEWLAEGHRVRAELFLKGRYKGMEEAFLKQRLEKFLLLIPYAYKIAEPIARSPKGFAGIVDRDQAAGKKQPSEPKETHENK